MPATSNVLGAVSNNKLLSSQGLMQRLFAFWFDAFVYNQIWEDPRVDIVALELDADSRVLTISSGGCNALNYLVEGPQSVSAVDLNRYHIYLLELKLAALRSLPHPEDFFNFFGRGKHEANSANYNRYVAPELSREARQFWEGNGLFGSMVHGKRIEYFDRGGLYEFSRNGYFLRFFHRLAHQFGLQPEKLLEANSIAEQEELFDRHIAPFFNSKTVRLIGKLPVTTFGLGIPPQQLDELKQDLDGGSLLDIYRARARKLACGFPINENYFAWQAFGRRYDTEKRHAIPNYLVAENFDALKANAHRVSTYIGSFTDRIKSAPIGSFNRFVLLDAQDWMNKKVMTELWQAIADRGEPGSRIIFRSAAAASSVERTLPADLRNRFVYERDRSFDLFQFDRASIYGGFHLYTLKN